jgi:hypothetical protein
MNIEKDKLNFVIELTKRQLEFVKSSDKKDVNNVALGLFDNEIFVDVLSQINGANFVFHTKNGFKTDDKYALIYIIERIIENFKESKT